MIEALVYAVVEVFLYGKGYWTLRLLSCGQLEPGRWKNGLVSLVGLGVTLAWAVPLLIWLSGQGSVALR